MSRPRFVFLSVVEPIRDDGAALSQSSGWMLVAPNNRMLGRSGRLFDADAECRAAAHLLRERIAWVSPVSTAVKATGQWVWRVELAGLPVAVAGRSYLRARECQYNLERFLEAVPKAEFTSGLRIVRRGSTAPPPAFRKTG